MNEPTSFNGWIKKKKQNNNQEQTVSMPFFYLQVEFQDERNSSDSFLINKWWKNEKGFQIQEKKIIRRN